MPITKSEFQFFVNSQIANTLPTINDIAQISGLSLEDIADVMLKESEKFYTKVKSVSEEFGIES